MVGMNISLPLISSASWHSSKKIIYTTWTSMTILPISCKKCLPDSSDINLIPLLLPNIQIAYDHFHWVRRTIFPISSNTWNFSLHHMAQRCRLAIVRMRVTILAIFTLTKLSTLKARTIALTVFLSAHRFFASALSSRSQCRYSFKVIRMSQIG